ANVERIGPLRMDGALWTLPPPRQPGQKGRPRKRGARLPTPAAQAQTRTAHDAWHPLPVRLYGRQVTPLVFRGTALLYSALPDAPLPYGVVLAPLRQAGTTHVATWCPPVGLLTPPCPPRRPQNARRRACAIKRLRA